MDFRIIDSHVHCGIQNVSWGWEHVWPLLNAAGIEGVGLIPPVEDVYDRFNRRFIDSHFWQDCRRRAHGYLLCLNDGCRGCSEEDHRGKDPGQTCPSCKIKIYPYFFVWNDFAKEDLTSSYVGIKWHRHPDEPEYQYDNPRCREFLEVVRARRLPILLEESFENTLLFLDHLAGGIPVVIPHLGALNGGFDNLKKAGIWDSPQVYADSAAAAPQDLEEFLGHYGSDRLIFGSDFPFGHPKAELGKIFALNLPDNQTQAILGDNFRRLYGVI